MIILLRHDDQTRDALMMALDRELISLLYRFLRQPAAHAALALSTAAAYIDHFKRYNDAFGHLAGNVVLREFADVARPLQRATRSPARWSGEEFFSLLPQCTHEGALEVAERIRDAVSRHPFPSDS